MGKKNRKIDSKEFGLELGLLVFKHFLKTEYLHYGYFTPDMEVDIGQMKKAQENYFTYLAGKIPAGTRHILDVGCGSGKTAEELMSMGYTVSCVSPGKLLTDYARQKLPGQVVIHNAKFQDLEVDESYDLILFSESFQYIPLSKSLNQAKKMLKPGGHIIICDFFKTDAPGKSQLRGGHSFATWLDHLGSSGLRVIEEEDITAYTAPTLDVVNNFSMEVLKPAWKNLFLLGEDRFPLVTKFVKYKYKRKIAKMERKHFGGERNSSNFTMYKKYMFYLLQYTGN